jgi:hypothetical protein
MIFGKTYSIRDVGERSRKLLPHALTHVGQHRPLTLRRALWAALGYVASEWSSTPERRSLAEAFTASAGGAP